MSLKWAQVDPVSCPDLTALNNQMGPQDIRNGCNQIRNWANQNLFNISYFEPCLVFLSGKKIMLKIFVRASKCTKMSVFSCILFWDTNFENPLNRFNAAMFFLRPLKLKILILSSEYLVNRWRYCSTVKYYLKLNVIMSTNFWPSFLRIPW